MFSFLFQNSATTNPNLLPPKLPQKNCHHQHYPKIMATTITENPNHNHQNSTPTTTTTATHHHKKGLTIIIHHTLQENWAIAAVPPACYALSQ